MLLFSSNKWEDFWFNHSTKGLEIGRSVISLPLSSMYLRLVQHYKKRVFYSCFAWCEHLSSWSAYFTFIFFADDNLIFAKANVVECRSLVNCLKAYKDASRQKIYLERFGISYSPNVDLKVMEELNYIMSLHVARAHKKYLGLPTVIRKCRLF